MIAEDCSQWDRAFERVRIEVCWGRANANVYLLGYVLLGYILSAKNILINFISYRGYR